MLCSEPVVDCHLLRRIQQRGVGLAEAKMHDCVCDHPKKQHAGRMRHCREDHDGLGQFWGWSVDVFFLSARG
jgi:hypothetical protein